MQDCPHQARCRLEATSVLATGAFLHLGQSCHDGLVLLCISLSVIHFVSVCIRNTDTDLPRQSRHDGLVYTVQISVHLRPHNTVLYPFLTKLGILSFRFRWFRRTVLQVALTDAVFWIWSLICPLKKKKVWSILKYNVSLIACLHLDWPRLSKSQCSVVVKTQDF